MQQPATDTVTVDPTWLLKLRSAASGQIRSRLRPRRLISYGDVSSALFRQFDYLDHLMSLYEHLFGERPQAQGIYSIWEMESAIITKIDEDHFPLDLSSIHMTRGADEQLMFFIMPIQGWAVGWHMMHFGEMHDADKPMVAACTSVIYADGGGANADPILDWWQTHGYEPKGYSWVTDHDAAPMLLRRLPEPLDGLAGLYRATVPVGNPFFDYVNYDWDYLTWEDIVWDPDVIDLLTTLWENAEDDVERLQAYYSWFQYQDDTAAIARIVNAFEQVEEWYFYESGVGYA